MCGRVNVIARTSDTQRVCDTLTFGPTFALATLVSNPEMKPSTVVTFLIFIWSNRVVAKLKLCRGFRYEGFLNNTRPSFRP
jgi:hypothetical protein